MLSKKGIFAIAAGAFIVGTVLSFFMFNEQQNKPSTHTPLSNVLINKHRPDFSLPDIEGNIRHVSEWDKKVLIINFWATWCPPCKREMPAFIELQETFEAQGLQFVGIAIDTLDNVVDFVNTLGVNYPTLIGEQKAIEIAQLYGDRLGTLPHTVIIDRSGKIVFVKQGEIAKTIVKQIITPLL